VRRELLHDNCDYTPYEGMTLTGWPLLTLSRGEVVWNDGEVLAQPGRGRFLRLCGWCRWDAGRGGSLAGACFVEA
jgi:hypothetical protein